MLTGSTLSTAVLALILGGAGLIFSVFNFFVAARNRRLDEEDKKDQRAAEQSYKYSKEVQVVEAVHSWHFSQEMTSSVYLSAPQFSHFKVHNMFEGACDSFVLLQHILIEVERYKRQVCGDSDQVYYKRLKECLHEEDWEVKSKLTVVHGFWRETIFLWKKVHIS